MVIKPNFSRSANNVAWICALSPASGVEPAQLRQLAEKGASQRRTQANLNTLGAALYRTGQYADAVKRLNNSIAAHGHGGTAHNWVFLAMAHARLGHDAEAREWLDKAAKWLDQVTLQVEASGTTDPSFNWQNRITLPLLLREAVALLARRAAECPTGE